jgi:7-cyano-7-deazaguanine synthase
VKESPPPAVALVSGGLDSAVAAACAKAEGRIVHALSFDYGQRNRVELRAAARVAEALGLDSHRVIRVDLTAIGGSALTADIPVPKDRTDDEIGRDVPITYVPARNTVFLSLGLALAEVTGADAVFIGVNSVDSSGYPDCREPYLRAFETLANLATAPRPVSRPPYRIAAPRGHLTKPMIIRQGLALKVPFELTHSCYDPVGDEGLACGGCDACFLRRRGFEDARVPDPTRYAPKPAAKKRRRA